MAHDGTSSVANSAAVWRAGTLSIDDLDRLAGEIRPSWEVGLDAADVEGANVARSAPLAPVADGFVAAPARLVAEMGAIGTPAVSVPPFNAQPPIAQPARPTSHRPSPPPVASQRPAAPPVARVAGFDDPVLLPRRAPATMVYVGIAGAVAVVAFVGFLAFRGPPAQTAPAAPSTVATVPALTPPTPVVAHSAAIAVPPPQSPVLPAAPAAHVTVAPVATNAPAPASNHTSAASTPVHSHPRAVATTNSTPAQHSSATTTTHHPRGVGFVTSSPY